VPPSSSKCRPDPSVWQTLDLRVTFFYRDDVPLHAAGTWERVTGSQPDSQRSSPKTGQVVESGTYGDSQLELVFASEPADGRLEWHLRAPDLFESKHASFDETPSEFLQLMDKYIQTLSMPSVQRAALGVSVLRRVKDLAQGYSEISNYLPFQVDYADSSDFLYQINRKRPSQVLPGTEVNRLMKWSVVVLGRRILRLTGSRIAEMKGTDASIVKPVDDQVALNLELDINTATNEDSSLEVGKLSELLREFVELAREILAKGATC
jgi:hypothetical protein